MCVVGAGGVSLCVGAGCVGLCAGAGCVRLCGGCGVEVRLIVPLLVRWLASVEWRGAVCECGEEKCDLPLVSVEWQGAVGECREERCDLPVVSALSV